MRTKTPKIRRGSAVSMILGGRRVKALVIEDPREFLPGGIHLLRVRADLKDGFEPFECDVRSDDVTAMPVRRRRAA